MSFKQGRNDLCGCGSGKKYKKCCIHKDDNNSNRFASLVSKSKSILGTSKFSFVPNQIKISELMLDLLSEYRNESEDIESIKTLLGIGCIAWNLSFIEDHSRQLELKEMLNKFFGSSENKSKIIELINDIIEKKLRKYPDIKRSIVSYEVVEMGDEYDIQIASTP